ncbi:MAG TPA: hypothetical protein VLE99_02000 [Candidatus Saccharimonadales bacterium]|nr:hypothetical protein [Candidatus Saccharimonadales bacterium]
MNRLRSQPPTAVELERRADRLDRWESRAYKSFLICMGMFTLSATEVVVGDDSGEPGLKSMAIFGIAAVLSGITGQISGYRAMWLNRRARSASRAERLAAPLPVQTPPPAVQPPAQALPPARERGDSLLDGAYAEQFTAMTASLTADRVAPHEGDPLSVTGLLDAAGFDEFMSREFPDGLRPAVTTED